MNALYFAMMATRATGGSMTKADTDAIERVALIKGALAANLDLSDELLIELQTSGNLDATAEAINQALSSSAKERS